MLEFSVLNAYQVPKKLDFFRVRSIGLELVIQRARWNDSAPETAVLRDGMEDVEIAD